jgi:hypothetical protein
MAKPLYQQYIEVSKKLTLLKDEQKELLKKINKKFETEKLEKVEAPNGVITKVSRLLWKYPEKVKEEISSLQLAAQKDKTAEQVESTFLKITLR